MHRKPFAVLLAVVGLFVSVSGANASPPEAVHLALGDSLGVGTGAPTENQTGYVPRLFNAAHGLTGVAELANLSEGGETSATFLSDGQWTAALAAIVDPSTDIGLVTLDIGGDDLLPLLKDPACAFDPTSGACQALVGNAVLGFSANFPIIIGSLQAALAGSDPAPLLVMTYYNPFSGSGSPFEVPVDVALLGADGVIDCSQLGVAANVGLNDLIACIGAAAGATVVDVYPEFAGRGALLTHIDELDVHPNAAGHAAIARAFKAALK